MEQALTQPSRPHPVSSPHPVPVVNRTPLQAGDHHPSSGSPSLAYLPAAGAPPSRPAGDINAEGAGSSSAPSDSGSGVNGSPAAGIQDPGGEHPGEETPGRSPRRTAPPPASAAEAGAQQLASRERIIPASHVLLAGSSDPLGEGLGLLAGMAIGLLTLVVPLLSVITDRPANPGLADGQTHVAPSRLP